MKDIYVKLIPVKQEAQWFPGTSFHFSEEQQCVCHTAYTPDQTAVLLLYRCDLKSLCLICAIIIYFFQYIKETYSMVAGK